jgi:hypothetical protein
LMNRVADPDPIRWRRSSVRGSVRRHLAGTAAGRFEFALSTALEMLWMRCLDTGVFWLIAAGSERSET